MLTKIRSALASGFKALSRDRLRFPGRSFVFFALNRASQNEMETEVGDGTNSDLLMSVLRWIQRSAVEPPLVALDEDDAPVGGALQDLIDAPNPFYGCDLLISGLIYDLSTSGNAYILPVANGNDRVAELWWAPASAIEPKWPNRPTPKQVESGEAFISHYNYTVEGRQPEKIAPTDIIHFRQGVDPQNIRKGLSPLRGLLREIFTDQEAASYTAGLLKTGAVPGMVIAAKPQGEHTEKLTPDEAKAAKDRMESGFTGEQRGRVAVFSGPIDVQQFGFNPQQLDLSALRNVSEERVTAALGVQASVVGFGSGLEQTKVGATMEENVRLSYRNGVKPLWMIIQRTLTQRLVPMVNGASGGATRVRFDLSEVEALQEDQDRKAARVGRLVRDGVYTRALALEELGHEATPADEVYLLPMGIMEVPAGRQLIDVTPEARAMRLLAGAKHRHGSLTEERIIETAPQVTAPAAVLEFARWEDRLRESFPAEMAARLVPIFESLGREAERVALEILTRRGERAGPTGERKADEDLIAEILEALGLADVATELRAAFASSYRDVARRMSARIAEDFDFIVPDEFQLRVMQEGGLRAGLIDLDAQTRDALFDALAEARSEGLAGENLARRIRDRIEAGPWRDVTTRARVIARTEGAHAANTATIEAARGMDDTEHMMVLDDRTGFGDEVCTAINGRVVTIAEAEALGLAHPNCTRSFTPINALLMEEMGL